MDHKNKFKNKARVIKYVLQVLKRSKEFLSPTLITSWGNIMRNMQKVKIGYKSCLILFYNNICC